MSSFSRAVLTDSPRFRAAVERGDATEALRLGRKIMYACQQHIQFLSVNAAQRSWLGRLGLANRSGIAQEAAHFEAISEHVSIALHGMGLAAASGGNDAAACEAEPLVTERVEARDEEAQRIYNDMTHIARLYAVILDIVQRANPLVASFERRIDDTARQVDRANDEFLRYYTANPSARTFGPCGLSASTSAVLLCVCTAAGLLLFG